MYDHGDHEVDVYWLHVLNKELEQIEIPEFFPELDALNKCRAMLTPAERNGIFNAALFAHANNHTAAEKCRVDAGYGGLERSI